MARFWIVLLLLISPNCFSQGKASDGLSEKLVSVSLSENSKLNGVLSLKEGTSSPAVLVVLLPGHPAVIKPIVVEGNKVVKMSMSGNFLLRARRQLINSEIATLAVDCRESFAIGDECPESYMASKSRFDDFSIINNEVRKDQPSIKKVWQLGTSFGTVTSSHIPKERFAEYSGVIHTSTINNASKYSTQYGVKYDEIAIPQLFIHHANDACAVSKYEGILDIAQKAKIPLYTILGDKKRADEKISAESCNAFSPHGFKGIEVQVMQLIRKAITEGIQQSTSFEY